MINCFWQIQRGLKRCGQKLGSLGSRKWNFRRTNNGSVDSSSMDGPVAVVSHTFSPDLNGQAVVLGRLLEGMPAVVRISSARFWSPNHVPGFINENVSPPWAIRKMRKLKFLESSVFGFHVRNRAQKIARALVRHNCSAVVACTGGDLVDLPAALIAAERVEIPCVLHYFDDYRSQWKIPIPAWSMRWMQQNGSAIEAQILRKAAGIVVPNEFLRSDLAERVDLRAIIIRNPVNLSAYENLRSSVSERQEGASRSWTLTYTGSIYEAQLDAVCNCARGLELLNDRGISMQLHLYTSQSEKFLHSQGIPRSVRIHPAVKPMEASRLQCESDFLLLPLAFKTRYPELIRTSSPGKMGEYLAAGRPILVHAPADSFVAKFASDHRCGFVNDKLDVSQIAKDLERLVREPHLRAELSNRAIASSLQFSESLNRDEYFRFIRESRVSQPMTQTSLRCA